MMYNKTVNDYFFMPQHVGTLDLAQDFTVMTENALKGQGSIELYMQCNQDKRILAMRFKTNGNPYLIASLEWLCRRLEGQLIESIAPMDYQLLIKELAIPGTQYPLALRVTTVLQEILLLIKSRYK